MTTTHGTTAAEQAPWIRRLSPEPLALRCACGEVRGTLLAHRRCAWRCTCYCDDCQTYANYLGSPVLDEHGGTEVVQTWPALVRLEAGVDRVRLLRLSPKGLHRWFTDCCRSPLANSLRSPRFPFVGLNARRIEATDRLDAIFGPPQGVQGRFAIGGCPEGASATVAPSAAAAVAVMLGRGLLRGAHRPHPLFEGGRPIATARILTLEERNAARPTHRPRQ